MPADSGAMQAEAILVCPVDCAGRAGEGSKQQGDDVSARTVGMVMTCKGKADCCPRNRTVDICCCAGVPLCSRHRHRRSPARIMHHTEHNKLVCMGREATPATQECKESPCSHTSDGHPAAPRTPCNAHLGRCSGVWWLRAARCGWVWGNQEEGQHQGAGCWLRKAFCVWKSPEWPCLPAPGRTAP
jgi:hypothetical protein